MAQRTPEPPISWLMQAALTRPRLISLAAGFTDNPSLPVAETRAALNQILRSPKTGRPALQYGSTAGDPALRELTAEHLRKLDWGAADSSRARPRPRIKSRTKDDDGRTKPIRPNACSSPAVRSNCFT